METRLYKSPEVKALLRQLKRLAPHILFTPRDRERHYARQTALGGPFYEAMRTEAKPFAERHSHTAPLTPKKAHEDQFTGPQKYTKAGESIPKRVKRGDDFTLTDKPKR